MQWIVQRHALTLALHNLTLHATWLHPRMCILEQAKRWLLLSCACLHLVAAAQQLLQCLHRLLLNWLHGVLLQRLHGGLLLNDEVLRRRQCVHVIALTWLLLLLCLRLRLLWQLLCLWLLLLLNLWLQLLSLLLLVGLLLLWLLLYTIDLPR